MTNATNGIRARLGEKTKIRPTAALETRGIPVPDAIRILVMRVADDQRLEQDVHHLSNAGRKLRGGVILNCHLSFGNPISPSQSHRERQAVRNATRPWVMVPGAPGVMTSLTLRTGFRHLVFSCTMKGIAAFSRVTPALSRGADTTSDSLSVDFARASQGVAQHVTVEAGTLCHVEDHLLAP